jgi:hypothetical protein
MLTAELTSHPDVLREASGWGHPDVRRTAAENAHCPEDVLVTLLDDDDDDVRRAAIEGLPDEYLALHRIIARDGGPT